LSVPGGSDKLTLSRPAIATSAAGLCAVATPARILKEGAAMWVVASTGLPC
jgi:hypothetical protein